MNIDIRIRIIGQIIEIDVNREKEYPMKHVKKCQNAVFVVCLGIKPYYSWHEKKSFN